MDLANKNLLSGLNTYLCSAILLVSFCFCSQAYAQSPTSDFTNSENTSPEVRPIVVIYEPPASDRKLSRIYMFAKQIKILELLAQAANRRVDFSSATVNLTIKAKRCGQVNAFYEPRSRTITMCYEFLNRVLLDLPDEVKRGQEDSAWFGTHRPEQRDVIGFAVGAVSYVFFHELGHAVIDMFRLPILGKEEDAADQISIYLLLKENTPEIALKGALWFNKGARIFFSRSDVHSWGPQRQVNLACWAYGGNRRDYAGLIPLAKVSQERLRACTSEYVQIRSSVSKLMAEHLKK